MNRMNYDNFPTNNLRNRSHSKTHMSTTDKPFMIEALTDSRDTRGQDAWELRITVTRGALKIFAPMAGFALALGLASPMIALGALGITVYLWRRQYTDDYGYDDNEE